MLPLEELVAAVGILALTAYALLAIADFGGGVWDLLAQGPRREAHQQAIARAMGPVWETNHVWLIFFIVILFSAFPPAFAALSIAMFIPFHLVLLGIILRGAAFVFRAHGATAAGWRRTWGSIFGSASVITPILLGMALAAVSSGGIRVIDGRVDVDLAGSWLSPFAVVTGAITLALGAYLAAVYLTVETEGDMQNDFRRRALWAGGAVAALAALALPLMAAEAPRLWSNLGGRFAELLIGLGLFLAGVSTWAVVRRRYRLARLLAGGEVVTLLWGWALAQRPYIIYPDVTVMNAAAPAATLRFVLWTLPIGGLFLIPALWFLFSVFKGDNPQAKEPLE